MPDAPIFILGTERSGSNLLRLILNSHTRIFVPHPPHVVRYFAPLERGYGDLAQDGALRRLVQDVLALVAVHIHPWDFVPDAERLVRTASPRNVFGVYAALMEAAREAEGKPRWACKSVFMIDHVPAILERYPAARLIFLVRDPRDVAASSKRSVFSTFHPFYTAKLWTRHQELGLHWLGKLAPETIRLVRYEELVATPESCVAGLCTFLDEPFEPAMLRFFETAEAKRSASLSESWGRTADPVSAASVGRHREELSDEETRIVESVAAAAMGRLGYAPRFPVSAIPGSKLRFWLGDLALWLRTELRSLRADKNVRRRWARAWLLWRLSLRRG